MKCQIIVPLSQPHPRKKKKLSVEEEEGEIVEDVEKDTSHSGKVWFTSVVTYINIYIYIYIYYHNCRCVILFSFFLETHSCNWS